MGEPNTCHVSDDGRIWPQRRHRRFELVDGVPQPPVKAARASYDRLGIIATMHRRLTGARCQALGRDPAVRIAADQTRQPGIAVEWGETRPRDRNPCATADAPSSGTTSFDRSRRLAGLQTITTLASVLLIDTLMMDVTSRGPDGGATGTGCDAVASASSPSVMGASLGLDDVAEGVPIESR